MIKSNIRLVISIAKNYQGAGMNLQDLVQVEIFFFSVHWSPRAHVQDEMIFLLNYELEYIWEENLRCGDLLSDL